MEVTYLNHMGTDDTIVNAARVSFNREALSFSSEQNERLIKYLAKHNHWTPFSHCMITLREKVPIFVARQRFKHMVGFTYNEVSRRYVDDEPEFYVPEVWRKRAENKKQGSSDEEISHINWQHEGSDGYGKIEKFVNVVLMQCERLYNDLLKAGVAPEQARMVLPQSMYTEYYTSGSLAAFARAYKLRSSEDSQKEIQELATQWDAIIRPLFPIGWSSLVDA